MTPIRNAALVFPPCCFSSEASFPPLSHSSTSERAVSTALQVAMETELSFLPPVYLGQGTAAKSSLSQEEKGGRGGGERRENQLALNQIIPVWSGSLPRSPRPLLLYSTAVPRRAVEGGREGGSSSCEALVEKVLDLWYPCPNSKWTCLPQGQSLASSASSGGAAPG